LQLSAVPVPVTYTPIQPVPQIGAVKGRDGQADSQDPNQKLRPTPPPGVGTLFDISA
jgi:hypothetical protein